ncbi:MAG: hypothetical protein A3I39_02775 [Candidatus Yanofskybacteria bacterium RIFCSPLOWO2_02_FULL_47_9b]|uniref:SIS domain-containing protein n=1 Tax=Candidatus Yanofskybacteria bacterium RIFCSPLOWO2_02_FULL_47_9b TaxID=1802708 RepID=A0A1F8HAB7_9BACT|nr:MAG: hypothetical protein A3I39_02775 [Candidatus Yanofskybacteria bacterium RIFCSPLOWO2_02_FULL_47_9b]
MNYRDLILNLPNQFKYQPEIINADKLRPFKHIIIAGMGGSRLAPDILKMLRPDLDIHIHSNFGLPVVRDDANTLVIANSYSGNTAETISVAQEALKQGLPLAIVASGGKLIEFAAANHLPHIVIPEQNLPPRTAIGYSLVALAALLGLDRDIFAGWQTPVSDELVQQSKDIAEILQGGIPLIYCADQYKELGYVWKTILNETAKVPAFCNRYPEFFHNEIASYDSTLAKQLRVLVIGANQERLLNFLKEKNIPHTNIVFDSNIASAIILVHLTALALAEIAGMDPLSTPAIDEFKKLA